MNRRPLSLCLVVIALVACDDDDSGTDAALSTDAAVALDGSVEPDGAVPDAAVMVDADPVADAQVDSTTSPFRFWVEPSSFMLTPGACVGLKAKVQRFGYDGLIYIGVGATSARVSVSTSHIAAGTSEGDVTFITPVDHEPLSGSHVLLAATNDQHRERQLLYVPVDILPQPPGDAGIPDGRINWSTLEDGVCESLVKVVR